MTTALLSVATAAAMFVSTSLHPAASPSAQIPLTRVLPENNYVAYSVHKGDTLDSIAQDYYKDTVYWTDLWNDNPWIKDPSALEEGGLVKLHLVKPEKPGALDEELKARYDGLHPHLRAAVVLQVPDRVYPQSSFEEVYKAAGAKYGVPWQVLYGIHMTETGLRNGAIFNHSGSGAQGPMQFMPGTFRAYAVDGDGDGAPDINNAVDAIYTAANYLARHGSLMAGLRSYGGNIVGTLSAARSKGYTE